VTRSRWWDVARVAFVVLAVGFGWWWLRGRWPEVLESLAAVGAGRTLLALVVVLAGLLLTGVVWADLLAAYGFGVPRPSAMSVFFVGQIGKYIPGSVWSFGAQARMATRYDVPARTTVATGLVFLWWSVVTAVLAAGAGLLAGLDVYGLPTWLGAVAVAAGLAALTPPVTTRLAGWLAGVQRPGHSPRLAARLTALMCASWLLYGAALALLVPAGSTSWGGLLRATGAFALAYAVGVVVVVAPAGLGAREVVLVALLATVVGAGPAAAAALLSRLVHTGGDFLLALAGWRSTRQE
jgi:uncharacterized membrane protein YbhN (UPF0104 family)